MGWWKIDNVENGQIDPEWDSGSSLINAIPGKHDRKLMFNGDGPADSMGACIDDIVKQYKDAWGRRPLRKELQAVFNFVVNVTGLYKGHD